jgi:hypothetical protein
MDQICPQDKMLILGSVKRQDNRAVHRVRQQSGENHPAGLIHDRYRITESFHHKDLGDIHGPHMVCTYDLKSAEMTGMPTPPCSHYGAALPLIHLSSFLRLALKALCNKAYRSVAELSTML